MLKAIFFVTSFLPKYLLIDFTSIKVIKKTDIVLASAIPFIPNLLANKKLKTKLINIPTILFFIGVIVS